MIGHIYLYGEFANYQDSEASSWGIVNLKDVMNQVSAQKDSERFLVHIHSNGGSVDEGFAIHDYLQSLNTPIDTQIDGVCRSIATVVALGGENRTIGENGSILIHNPWGYSGGEAEDMRRDADLLEEIENKLGAFYESNTNLTKDEALQYMKVETSFDAEKALEIGFVTEISKKTNAVAYFQSKKNSMKNLSKEEKASKLEKFQNFVTSLMSGDESKNLILQDANGKEIDFQNLAENETPKIGDSATVNQKPAEGEFVMPSGETWAFKSGKLDKQIEATDPKDVEIQNLKNQLAEVKASKETEMQNLKAENETGITEMKAQLESDFNDKFTEFKSSFNPFNKKEEDEKGTGKRFGVKVKQK